MKAALALGVGFAIALAATNGRPLWWSAIGLALASLAALSFLHAGQRARLAPLVVILTAIAIVTSAFAIATQG